MFPSSADLGDTLVAEGGVKEAARARVRCAWAKFKELSSILTVRGASHRIKIIIIIIIHIIKYEEIESQEIYKACAREY